MSRAVRQGIRHAAARVVAKSAEALHPLRLERAAMIGVGARLVGLLLGYGRPTPHDRAMKSRVHPTYKTHLPCGNWRVYERGLVSRGDVTLWLSADASAAWGVPPSGRPGGQRRFADLAIETALTIRLGFRLPLRQTEGFVRSILTVMGAGLDAPDHTILSRRSQSLDGRWCTALLSLRR